MKCRCRRNQYSRVKLAGFYRNVNGYVQRFMCCRCGHSWSDNPMRPTRQPLATVERVAKLLRQGHSLRAASRAVGKSHGSSTVRRIAVALGIKISAPRNLAWIEERKNKQ